MKMGGEGIRNNIWVLVLDLRCETQDARRKTQEAKEEKQEARDERQEARDERRETRKGLGRKRAFLCLFEGGTTEKSIFSKRPRWDSRSHHYAIFTTKTLKRG